MTLRLRAESASMVTLRENATAARAVDLPDAAGVVVLDTATQELSNKTFVANGSSPAVRITQTGDGDALVVEDSTSPDATPFVVNNQGRLAIGKTTLLQTGDYTGNIECVGVDAVENSGNITIGRFATSANSAQINFLKARGTVESPQNTQINDPSGSLYFWNYFGTSFLPTGFLRGASDGTPSETSMPGRIVFSTTPAGSTTPTEKFRIDNAGRAGLGTGGAFTETSLRVYRNLTGAATLFGIASNGSVQSDATSSVQMFRSAPITAAATFTLSQLVGYMAGQGAFGLGSSVTNQIGFFAQGTLIGATNNFGFYSDITTAVGRWNFYANGTAPNYFAGNVTANAAFNQTPTRSTVASGSTITLTTATNHLLYDQAATVAALTVTLPSASLVDGQTITLATRSAITALTVNGGTIYGAPTTLGAGGFASFIYSSGAAAWFRKG
jgi:hypothetical protein